MPETHCRRVLLRTVSDPTTYDAAPACWRHIRDCTRRAVPLLPTGCQSRYTCADVTWVSQDAPDWLEGPVRCENICGLQNCPTGVVQCSTGGSERELPWQHEFRLRIRTPASAMCPRLKDGYCGFSLSSERQLGLPRLI